VLNSARHFFFWITFCGVLFLTSGLRCSVVWPNVVRSKICFRHRYWDVTFEDRMSFKVVFHRTWDNMSFNQMSFFGFLSSTSDVLWLNYILRYNVVWPNVIQSVIWFDNRWTLDETSDDQITCCKRKNLLPWWFKFLLKVDHW
jgi:hypothetical protein